MSGVTYCGKDISIKDKSAELFVQNTAQNPLLFPDITLQNFNLIIQSNLHKEIENRYNKRPLNLEEHHSLYRKWIMLLLSPRNQTQKL
jgi:hypothetical protein